jgi:ribonucleoside-diphosphate reductase alpha chain
VKEKIIESQGDISEIAEIPAHIKEVYKTSFTTSPYAFIEVAARAQKWVDQALSRNMYLETRDLDETMKIYSAAWEKGLKSTYYLHMKPRHTAEQSTTRVNKAEKMGKIGFSGVARKSVVTDASVSVSIPAQKEAVISPLEMHTIHAVHTASPKAFASVATPVSNPIETKSRESAIEESTVETPKAKETSSPKKSHYQPLSMNLLNSDGNTPQIGTTSKPKVMHVAKVCPTDPAERAQCDSCQ